MMISVKNRGDGVDGDGVGVGGESTTEVTSDDHDVATAGQQVESECYYGCDSTLRSAGVPRLMLSDYFCDETPLSRSPVPSSSPRANDDSDNNNNDGRRSTVSWSAIVDDSTDNNDNAAPHPLLTRGISRKLSADYYDLTNSGKRPNAGSDANPLADFSLDLLQQSGKYIPPGVLRQQSTIGIAGQGQRHVSYEAEATAAAEGLELGGEDDVDEHHAGVPADAMTTYQGLVGEGEVFHGHCTEEGREVLLAMLSRPEVGRRLTSSQWAQCLTR